MGTNPQRLAIAKATNAWNYNAFATAVGNVAKAMLAASG